MQGMNVLRINHESLFFNGLSDVRASGIHARSCRSRMQGFSLLEVLLVLVLAGILMGVVATSLSEGPVLRKSAREVAASLRHARSIAILKQAPVIWSMNIQAREFWVKGTVESKKSK